MRKTPVSGRPGRSRGVRAGYLAANSPLHEPHLDPLLEHHLIERAPVDTRVCSSNLCNRRNVPVDDEARSTCVKCDRPLSAASMTRFIRNIPGIARFVSHILAHADGWQLHGDEKESEGLTFYELRKQRADGREDALCMIVADKPPERVRRVFNRTGLPLVYIQASTDARHIYLDAEGSAHISLAYCLSAQESAETLSECDDLCKATLSRLLLQHEETILRAARASYDRLISPPRGVTGDDYEVDIFNVLRSLFPYTYRLARKGKIQPDGYVCIPNYRSASIEDVTSWNWSYDTKHSMRPNGYDLNIDEIRKVIQYLKRLRRDRRALFGINNRPRAHVLISNNLMQERVAHAAELIFGRDGVDDTQRDIRLVLMRQEFLVRLYELVRDHYDAIIRRRPFLGDELIELLEGTQVGGYRECSNKSRLSILSTRGGSGPLLMRDSLGAGIDS